MVRGFNIGIKEVEVLYYLYVVKTKALISCEATAQLICVFVFAYTKSRFSHDTAHIFELLYDKSRGAQQTL